MNRTRLPALGLVAGGAMLLWTSSAAAVTPELSCVAPRPGGFTAYFGYSNPGPPQIIGIGPRNSFTPAPADRGQDVFLFQDTPPRPGFADTRAHINAAADFTTTVSWNLDGAVATATAASPRCGFDLTVTTTTDRATARPGEDVTWTVTARNAGTSPIPRQQIILATQGLPPLSSRDTPPDEILPGEALTFQGITRPGAGDCGRVIEGIGEVGMGPGIVDTVETDLTNNGASAGFTVSCIRDVGVTAATDATTYSPGQDALYTLTVTNTGDVPVAPAEITLADPALTGLAPVGTLPASLAPRASITYRGTLAVTQAMCATGATNDARVTLAGDVNPANDRAARPVTVAGGSCSEVQVPGTGTGDPVAPLRTRLAVASAGTGRVRVGNLATYRITVRNSGRNPARRVVLQQILPPGAALTGTPDGATLVSGRLVWRLGDMAPGDRRTVRVSVRFGASGASERTGSAFAVAANAPRARVAYEVQVVARPRPRPQPPVTG